MIPVIHEDARKILVHCLKYHYHNLTHWGRVTQICVSKFTIIGSDNGLSPIRRQAISCTNAGILLIRTLGTNFSEILIQIHTFSNKKMHLKMSSGKCRPFCLDLNELRIKSIGACGSGLFIVNASNDFVFQNLSWHLKQSYKCNEIKFHILFPCRCDTLTTLWTRYSTSYPLSNKST